VTSGPPARIDRAALERIIQRAAELQTAEHPTGENLSADEVLALGKDVGIPQRYLQQAMLEERTRVTVADPSGLLDKVAGPATITAQRVVQGDPESTQRALIAYMEENELCCIQREQPGRVSWEPLGGFQAAIRRSSAAFGKNKRLYMLDKVDSIVAVFVPLEAGYTHVTITAETRKDRGAFIGGGVAFGSVGIAAAAALLVMGAFAPIAIAPIIAGSAAGWGVMRQYRPRAERVLLGLERALDHLERGSVKPAHQIPPKPPGLSSLLSGEIRRVLDR
jgi:hypothetical protein